MKKLLATIGSLCLVLILGIYTSGLVHADTFNNNRIIDDAVFNNTSTMNPGQIDAFLNQFPNSCLSTNNGFSAQDPIGYSPSGGYMYGANVSAGQVIYDAALAYGLNPQVLIATLQKEEGLVQGNGPYGCSALALSASIGYACPDSQTSHNYPQEGALATPLFYSHGNPVTSVSGTCVNSAVAAGFTEQLIRGSWLLKFGQQRSEGNVGWAVIRGNWNNSDDPKSCYGGPMTQGSYQRCPNTSASYYDGWVTIDGAATHMDNGATAALYWYTPHFHGNQSFFNIFTGWFGSTQFPFSVVQVPGDPGIYIKFDGMKQMINDMSTFTAWGFNKYPVQNISASELNSLPTYTSPLTRYVNQGQTNYYIDNGTAYAVSGAMFGQWGSFKGQGISAVYSKVLGLTNTGGNLTELVKTDGDSAIYLMDGGSLRPFSDLTTFSRWQPSGAAVINISNGMFSEYPKGSVINSNLVQASNGFEYLISNGAAYRLSTGQRAALPAGWTEPSVNVATVAGRSVYSLQYTLASPGDGGIYLLDGGQKRIFASYDLYTAYSNNTSPSIINSSLLASITNGALIDRSMFTFNGTNGLVEPGGRLKCFDGNAAESYALSSTALHLNDSSTLGYLLSRGCAGAATPYVKINGQPTIYALSSGTKLYVPDLGTLFSYAPQVSTTDISTTNSNLFPNGTGGLNKYVTDGTTKFLVDGGKRYSVDAATATAWNLSAPVTLGAGLLATMPQSSLPLSNHININGVDYLVDSGNSFRSPDVDLKLLWGLGTGSVALTGRSLDGLHNQGDLTRLTAPLAGNSPRAGAIYAVDNGSLLFIQSFTQLVNLRIPGNPTKVSDTLLNSMGAGSAPALNTYLLHDPGNYFVIDAGMRRGINGTSLQSAWIGSQSPSNVSYAFTNVFPNATPVGQAITTRGNPTIFYMNSGQRVGFSSYAAYTNSGYATTQTSNELMSLIPAKP